MSSRPEKNVGRGPGDGGRAAENRRRSCRRAQARRKSGDGPPSSLSARAGGGAGQAKAKGKERRQRMKHSGLRRACPVSQRLLRGGFNNGWKGRSARPNPQNKRRHSRASVLSDPLVVRRRHNECLALVIRNSRRNPKTTIPAIPAKSKPSDQSTALPVRTSGNIQLIETRIPPITTRQ